MEDGDGIAVPSQSDITEDENSRVGDNEDSQLSKQTSVREHLFPTTDKSFTDTNMFRNFVDFSNVNGDCVDKNADVSGRVIASSSTNSLSSVYSETTRDSIHDEDSNRHREVDSGSENGSKSSSSEAPVRESNLNLPKLEDSHHMSSELSDSSSNSDSSESEDSCVEKDDGDYNDNKLDDNARIISSPSQSNNCGDSEKDISSDVDTYKEQNDLKPSEETRDNTELKNDNLSNEHPETQNNTSIPIVEASASKTEDISKTVDNDQNKQQIAMETEQKHSSDNVEKAESVILSSSVPNYESPEHDEPIVDNTVASSTPSSEETVESQSNEIMTSKSEDFIELKSNENTKLKSEDFIELKSNENTKLKSEDFIELKSNENTKLKSEDFIELKSNENTKLKSDEIVKSRSDEIMELKSNENIKLKSDEMEMESKDESFLQKPQNPEEIEPEPQNVIQGLADPDLKEHVGEKPNVKQSERVLRNNKRKTDERVNVSELGEQFSIQYKGFKKSRTLSGVKADNQSVLTSNPFNPAWKRNYKNRFEVFRNFRHEIECSTLQPEYAQYLGLQPIVRFKCSNCGLSTFHSITALNAHLVHCRKNGKLISHSNEISPPPDVNSANIKLTRKVFLCSTCGTYYENCDLFLHMREFHRRYICLFCLFMAQCPEVLQEHLKEKHNITNQTYASLEELQKHSPQTFFLLCLRCDRVFTEMDDSINHKCAIKNSSDVEHNLFKKPRTDNFPLPESLNEVPNSSVCEISKSKTPPKLTKEVNISKSNSFPHITNETSSEEDHKDSQNVNTIENPLDVDGEVMNNKIERHGTAFKPDNLQLKVPSGIEIKPLVPGEKVNYERDEPNRSSIEIFPITSEPIKKKVKLVKKTKKIIKKTIKKKSSNMLKIKKVVEDIQNALPPTEPNETEAQLPISNPPVPEPMEQEPESPPIIEENLPIAPAPVPALCNDMPEVKRSLSQEIFKIKLPGEIDSDGESDDSQKLSLVVDENTNNSETDLRKNEDPAENGNSSPKENKSESENNGNIESNEITLAREDVAAMALTLDDKIENVPIQAVVKECVRTSCLSCNYCRHACKIAVNGKQLALHLLSEHRYTPVKNETHDDVVRKLLNSLEVLQTMYFNTETYDSSDPSIHIPYDQEKNYDCFQCSYVSSSHKDLYAHKRKCHTKSLLLCIMCKSNFYSYSELICHICPGSYNAKVQFHNVDLIFRCCFCRLDTIPSAFRLMVHLRKSHHTCDICLEMCTDQQKLSTHMWKHKLNHLCYRCGIAYASKPDITKHLFWKHGTESVLCKKCLQKKWPHVYHFCIPPTSFICEECNTSFSKAVALKVHKRIHGNDYPYSCEQCEKKFVSKKLLSRHLDRHNAIAQRKEKLLSPQEDKEEIINVTDLNDGKECSQNENSDTNKEVDGKDRGHKKHKKEKEKKEKKVVDVYDLPPLNLSSESDSSDEEDASKVLPTIEVTENNTIGMLSDVKLNPLIEDKQDNNPDMPKLDETREGELPNSLPSLDNELNSGTVNVCKTELEKQNSSSEVSLKPTPSEQISPFNNTTVNTLLPLGKEEPKMLDVDSTPNDQVEGIWENFYKTNPQNSKLPFPLCAMKSEVAYSIIMGDHDYCQQVKTEPIIKEDLPSASNLVASLSDDKLEEVTPIIPEKIPQTPPQKEQETSLTPTSMSKKKLKSPKKKISKTPDDNNSSSSSDSSTDSDTSSCSCGTNCSCSSSSSNSSTSSSSDSDSSTNEDKSRQDKRKKRKDKRIKQKSESEVEVAKENLLKSQETLLPVVPEDPPIRESELETDESTSDEEFYDRQPQIIANQMLAEKRQLVLLATGAPVNNGNASPTVITPSQEPVVTPPPPDPVETPKQKTKPKRKRKMITPKLPKIEKTLPLPDPYPKFLNETKPYSPFPQALTTPKQKPQLPIPQSPSLPEAGGSGPESDTRLSKRRRVPNKFYGYSSGEEEDAPKQTPKWRKLESQMTPVQTPKIQPNLAPPTPRIQLTVPKQVIRKPTYHKASLKSKQHSSTDSSDSGGSDVEERIPRPTAEEPIKADKDVYCYCRCPYDEVSEMIACDDANCKIEWFHFECVGILVPPRGQWFCPGCRKARGLPT